MCLNTFKIGKRKRKKKKKWTTQLRNHRLLLAQTRPKMHQISQAEFGPNPPNAGRPALMPNGNNLQSSAPEAQRARDSRSFHLGRDSRVQEHGHAILVAHGKEARAGLHCSVRRRRRGHCRHLGRSGDGVEALHRRSSPPCPRLRHCRLHRLR
jgi:hypothetical protein